MFRLIFSEDTWNHLTGSFFGYCLMIRIYPHSMGASIVIVVMYGLFWECWQALKFDNHFRHIDTWKDILANCLGIALAIWMGA